MFSFLIIFASSLGSTIRVLVTLPLDTSGVRVPLKYNVKFSRFCLFWRVAAGRQIVEWASTSFNTLDLLNEKREHEPGVLEGIHTQDVHQHPYIQLQLHIYPQHKDLLCNLTYYMDYLDILVYSHTLLFLHSGYIQRLDRKHLRCRDLA